MCVDSEPTDPPVDVLTMPPTGSPDPVASTCPVVPLAGPSTSMGKHQVIKLLDQGIPLP